ncbi:MAG: alpha/beta hydrolase [bacterium]|nr:alpha/beta hydrolase [bacterium]
MANQVVVIHGGESFKNKEDYLNYLKTREIDLDRYRTSDWKSNLRKDLGADYDLLLLKMPNPTDAKYEEWKITFDKITPLLNDEVILIGHSLGGVFLMKYLSENKFSKKIKALFSVAAPFYGEHEDYSLGEFAPSEDLSQVSEQAEEIISMHSKDDKIVPFSDFEAYKKALPEAEVVVFEDRGHFNQEEFPELIKEIKRII